MSKESAATKSIFFLLSEASKKRRKKERDEILQSLGVKDFFEEGSISIDKRTCKGLECKFCINACPTNALYWRSGEVDVTEELCIFCAACVANCIVDDCIKVTRKRPDGKLERYATSAGVFALLSSINSRKRIVTTKLLFQAEKGDSDETKNSSC